jgi:hypothetical protein
MYVFSKVSLTGKKRVKCSQCSKTVVRQKQFYQTLNPFNKTKNGNMKTRNDIIVELKDELAQWCMLPEICNKCEDKASQPTPAEIGCE